MQPDRLRDELRNNILTVTFTKVNGEERVMNCTLISSYLPETKGGSSSDKVITVWDTDKNAWRAFRPTSVKSVNYVGRSKRSN